jgi:glycosyltransferase involved in cell wall biosynthesis
MTGFVHIFVPAYGESPYLEECLDSINRNTDYLVSCTVLDDGSPTGNIRNTVEKFGGRFEYIRNDSNIGLAQNFQKAFDLSTSLYTVIMGSDDVIGPGYIEQLTEASEKFPSASLFQPRVTVINESSQVFKSFPDLVKNLINPGNHHLKVYDGRRILRRILVGDFFYFPAIAWKTEILQNYRLKPQLKTAVDLDVIARLAIADNTFVLGGQNAFKYRRHSQSVSMELGKGFERSMEEIEVHRQISRILRSSGRFSFSLLARMAITVRLNALYSALKNPGARTKILREVFRP